MCRKVFLPLIQHYVVGLLTPWAMSLNPCPCGWFLAPYYQLCLFLYSFSWNHTSPSKIWFLYIFFLNLSVFWTSYIVFRNLSLCALFCTCLLKRKQHKKPPHCVTSAPRGGAGFTRCFAIKQVSGSGNRAMSHFLKYFCVVNVLSVWGVQTYGRAPQSLLASRIFCGPEPLPSSAMSTSHFWRRITFHKW